MVQAIYAKMGLGITIYFYGGGSESGQRKVLDVFRKYQERYGEYLKGMFGGGGGSKFMQIYPATLYRAYIQVERICRKR